MHRFRPSRSRGFLIAGLAVVMAGASCVSAQAPRADLSPVEISPEEDAELLSEDLLTALAAESRESFDTSPVGEPQNPQAGERMAPGSLGTGYVPRTPISQCAIHNVPSQRHAMNLASDPWALQGGDPHRPVQLQIPAVKQAAEARYGRLCFDLPQGGRFHCSSEARSPGAWKDRLEALCQLSPQGRDCRATQREVLDAIASCDWQIHIDWAQKIGPGVPERAVRFDFPVNQVPCRGSDGSRTVCRSQQFPWPGMVTCFINTSEACEAGGGADRDGDGIIDQLDNCPAVANPSQADLDGDGIGDVCDADRDGDGVPNTTDNCPDVANPNQSDLDGDGIGDRCDPRDDRPPTSTAPELDLRCVLVDGDSEIRLSHPPTAGATAGKPLLSFRPGVGSTGRVVLRLVRADGTVVRVKCGE